MRGFATAACLAATACAAPATLTVTSLPPPSSTAATATLAELVRAHGSGGAAEIRRVLGERWRDRGAVEFDGAVVVGPGRVGTAVPLLLVARLNDLAPCRGSQAGVVVEDPPRLVGCGAQDLAALAAFVLAAEQVPRVTLIVGDSDDDIARHAPMATQVWTGGGLVLQGQDVDVFDVEAADLGMPAVIEIRAQLGERLDLGGIRHIHHARLDTCAGSQYLFARCIERIGLHISQHHVHSQ